jgi:citrate lyase beta subunit
MPAKTSFTSAELDALLAPLAGVPQALPFARQPVHTVYGGAQLFKRTTMSRVGELALAALDAGHLELSDSLRKRVREKLGREPVEDYRIDFEDGFGSRTDAEEDEAAVTAARETREASLPPFFGIRVKSLAADTRTRALRTLDLYLTALGGPLPANFVVTLPKVEYAAEVTALVSTLEQLERKLGLPKIPIEIMVETPRALYAPNGALALPSFFAAAAGRLRGAHFGAYDYTAALGIAASEQSLSHPACDLARQLMQIGFAGTPVWLSDGATSVLPVGADTAKVKAAQHLAFRDAHRSLHQGFYQGWDLHPAQLPARYAALYTFFKEGLVPATERLHNFVGRAAQASTVGTSFDDAATGQGLLNFFLRGLTCGALTEAEVTATGLSLPELQSRSFSQIVKARQ